MVEGLSRMPGPAAAFSTVAHFHSTEKHEPQAATSMEALRSDHSYNPRGLELWSHVAGYTASRPRYSSNEIEIAGITDQRNRILGGPSTGAAHYSYLDFPGSNGSTKTTTVPGPSSPPAVQGPFEKLVETESENLSAAQNISATKSGPLNVEPRRMYSEAVESVEAVAHLEFRDDDGWNLSSLVNSCKLQASAGGTNTSCLQAASFIPGCAEANASAPAVITVTATTCKSSFESGSTGSCSTPSLCVGSPATVTPAPPSCSAPPGLESLATGMVFDISRHHARVANVEASGTVESDHSTSIESLMSFGDCLEDRDSIVNFVDPNFWLHNEETLMADCTESVGRLPHSAGFISQFSEPVPLTKDPTLDDTANAGAYSAGIYESLEHGIVQWKLSGIVRNGRVSTDTVAVAPPANQSNLSSDYIHALLLGGDEMANSATCINESSKMGKSEHLGASAKPDGGVVVSADSQPCRMRWCDRPWTDDAMQAVRCQGMNQQLSRVSPHMAGAASTHEFSPEGSPTSPLDFHNLSPRLHLAQPSIARPRGAGTGNARGSLSADTDSNFLKELVHAVEANSSNRNKRSFDVMQAQSSTPNSVTAGVCRLAGFCRPLPQPSPRFGSSISGAGSAAMNGLHILEAPTSSRRENNAKFDPAALRALLNGIQQGSKEKQSSQYSNASYALDHSPSSLIGGVPPKIQRRRHGTATDPQSIAARTRREKFSDRIRILQTLVPNGERLDTVSTLSQTLEYVRFLQRQVWEFYNGTAGDISVSIQPAEKWKGIIRDRHSNSQSTIAF